MPQVSKKSVMMNTMKTKPAKYSLGTDAAVVEDPKKKSLIPIDNSTVGSSDVDSSKFIGPPTEARMKLKTEDVALDKVAAETKSTSKANVPATTHSLAQIADMDKVKAHQEKLNKYGAGLKVDGMWGAKTEAASRDLYPQYKTKSLVSSKPKQAVGKSMTTKVATTKSTNTNTSNGLSDKENGEYAALFADDTNRAKDLKRYKELEAKKTGKVDTTTSNPAIPVTGSGAPVVTKSKNNSTYDSLDLPETKLKDGSSIKKDKQGNQYYTNGRVMGANGKMSNVDKNTRVVKPIPKSSAQQAQEREKDLDRNARIETKMQGDSDLHVPAMVRHQAEKAVDIEDKETQKSEDKGKDLDKTDAAIYTAETVGPAVGRKMIGKGKISTLIGAGLMVLPTAADIVKTASDDKAKSVGDYAKSATKATLRGAALGTLGSTIAGGLKRTGKGLINSGKEADAINDMRKEADAGLTVAKAAKGVAKSVTAKTKANKALLKAAKEAQEVSKMRITPRASIGENFKDAAKETGAGKVYKAVTNNPLVRGIKGIKEYNKQNTKMDLTNKAKAEAKAASATAKVASDADAKLAKEGEDIATKNAKVAQDKIDAINNAANDSKIKTGGRGGTTMKGTGSNSVDRLTQESNAKVVQARKNIALKNKAVKQKVAKPINEAREAVAPAKAKARMMRLKTAEERAVAAVTPKPPTTVEQYKASKQKVPVTEPIVEPTAPKVELDKPKMKLSRKEKKASRRSNSKR